MKNNLIFTTEIPVLVNHLNYGGHLGYDSLLCILQDARMRWLQTLDSNATEINIGENIGWLIREVKITYLSESFYNDILKVDLFVSNLKKSRFDFNYIVTNTSQKKESCHAVTTQVCYNFELSKIVALPDLLINGFKT